ncbi:MAG: ZPR1 zinc finger domain-containing protein [Pyrobaculum sp.]
MDKHAREVNRELFKSYRDAAVLYDVETTCPLCGAKSFRYVEMLYQAPNFGDIFIQNGICSTCGYRYFDVEYAEVGRPLRAVFTANDKDDVAKTYLVRSKAATVYSPDLGFSLEPGVYGEAVITTVEGFLYKVIDYAERLKTLEPEKSEKVDRFIQLVAERIERGGFTLVVEDPLGKSFFIPHKPERVKVEYL